MPGDGMIILLLIISDIYIESRPVHGYPIPSETADPVILGSLVEQITSRRVIDDRCHILDTQIVCPGFHYRKGGLCLKLLIM